METIPDKPFEDESGRGMDDLIEEVDASVSEDKPGDTDAKVNGQYTCAYFAKEGCTMSLKFVVASFGGSLIGSVTGSGSEKAITLSSADSNIHKSLENDDICSVDAFKLRVHPDGEIYVRLRSGKPPSAFFFFTPQEEYEVFLKDLCSKKELKGLHMPKIFNVFNGKQVKEKEDPFRNSVHHHISSRLSAKNVTVRLTAEAFAYRQYWNAAIDGRRVRSSAAARSWDLPVTTPTGDLVKGNGITLYICGSNAVDGETLASVASRLKAVKNRRFNPLFRHTTKDGAFDHNLTLWSENLFGFYSIWVNKNDYQSLLELQGLSDGEYAPFPDVKKIDAAHKLLSLKAEGKKDTVPKPLPLEVDTKFPTGKRDQEFTTVTYVSAKSMQNQLPRVMVKSQDAIMGESTQNLGGMLWTNLNESARFEWAHRSAYSFGELAHPRGDAQISRNLVLGTKPANSLMCRYEDSLRRLVNTGDSRVVLTTTIPAAPKDRITQPVSEVLSAYGIPEDQTKAFKEAMSKNYTWFCPLLRYNVLCEESKNARARQAGGIRWIPMFRLRNVLVWEVTLDKVAEGSWFDGTTLEQAADIPPPVTQAIASNPFSFLSHLLPVSRNV